MPNTLTLAIASDERYLPGTIGTLASARNALDASTSLKIHFLHDALPDACQQRVLRALHRLKGSTEISFHQIEADFTDFPEFFFPSKLAYARLLLPEIVSDPRLVYIDVDILVLRNLVTLPECTLKNGIGAVVDASIPKIANDIGPNHGHGLKPGADHFNSGFLVLQAPFEVVFREAIEILKARTLQCKWHDQSALNYACNGDFTLLENVWNRQNHRDHFDPVEAITALEDRSINVHFVTKAKPWMGASLSPAETMFRTLLDAVDPGWRGTNTALSGHDPALPRKPCLDRLRPAFFRSRGWLKYLAGRNGTSDFTTARYWNRRVNDESRLYAERDRLQALYAGWRDQIHAGLR